MILINIAGKMNEMACTAIPGQWWDKVTGTTGSRLVPCPQRHVLQTNGVITPVHNEHDVNEVMLSDRRFARKVQYYINNPPRFSARELIEADYWLTLEDAAIEQRAEERKRGRLHPHPSAV